MMNICTGKMPDGVDGFTDELVDETAKKHGFDMAETEIEGDSENESYVEITVRLYATGSFMACQRRVEWLDMESDGDYSYLRCMVNDMVDGRADAVALQANDNLPDCVLAVFAKADIPITTCGELYETLRNGKTRGMLSNAGIVNRLQDGFMHGLTVDDFTNAMPTDRLYYDDAVCYLMRSMANGLDSPIMHRIAAINAGDGIIDGMMRVILLNMALDVRNEDDVIGMYWLIDHLGNVKAILHGADGRHIINDSVLSLMLQNISDFMLSAHLFGDDGEALGCQVSNAAELEDEKLYANAITAAILMKIIIPCMLDITHDRNVMRDAFSCMTGKESIGKVISCIHDDIIANIDNPMEFIEQAVIADMQETIMDGIEKAKE